MRKGLIVLLAAVLVTAFALPAMAEISFFGTARVLPTYYSNFDFDDKKPDAPILNEGGYTMGEHVRSELRLGWKAGGDKWKIMFIAETDVINEKDTADRSFYLAGTKGTNNNANAGGEFGIERVELNYTFTPALVLSTGWNIRAADIKTGGLLFGDDHPFIELGGKLTDNLKYALTYITINNRQTTASVSPVANDWRAYLLKFNAAVGSGNAKFDLSPLVLLSDNKMRNAKILYYGFEATGQIGMFKPSAEFIYADGEFRNTNPSKDIKAYAAFAGVEAAVSKAFNPYIAIRYATGDDNSSDNDVEGFVGITDIGRFTPLMGMDGAILGESMGNPYGNVLYSFAPERKFSTNQYGGIGNAGSGDNPGHRIIAVGSKGAVSEPLSYKAQVFFIWYDKVNNISVGSGQSVSKVDKYAGTTVDLQLTYKFSPNFSTYFIGSTFLPGDGIKQQLNATTADDTPAMLASLGLVWSY
ncbi:MAG: hypothetical protein AABY80_07075 [Candidatus Deferrimicrobiota bacterium]